LTGFLVTLYMFITLNRIGDSITGSVDGKPFGIAFSQQKFDTLVALRDQANAASTMEEVNTILEQFRAASKEDFKELVESKTPYLYVKPATGQFFLRIGQGSASRVSSEPLPQAFVDRILESVELGLDVLPLVKAWARFLRNPNYSRDKARRFANYINKTHLNSELVDKLMSEQGLSMNVAQSRATTYQTPITQEGLISTYKVSAELEHKWTLDAEGNPKRVPIKNAKIDEISGLVTFEDPEHVEDRIFYPVMMGLEGGDPFYCGSDLGHLIRVGQTHRLANWGQVNCNDDICCVKGLHVGNIDYIRGYQSEGTVTHNVFVDPMNIGAITNDGSGALRVLEYFVHSSFAGVNRGIYHSSTYAAQTDAVYEGMFQEAVARFEEDQEAKAERIKEQDALRTV
jgi:hypothetical protein